MLDVLKTGYQHTTDLSTFAAEDAHFTSPSSLTANKRVRAEKLKISCFRSISVLRGSLKSQVVKAFSK